MHCEIAVSALSLKAVYETVAKLIHSIDAFNLDWPVAENNLQLNDLYNKTSGWFLDMKYLSCGNMLFEFSIMYFIGLIPCLLWQAHYLITLYANKQILTSGAIHRVVPVWVCTVVESNCFAEPKSHI